jgi:hypothetical protein
VLLITGAAGGVQASFVTQVATVSPSTRFAITVAL